MMPAHEQLRRAIGSHSRCLTFTEHWMTRKIESLFRRQRAGGLDVITLHHHLTEVVQERRCVQGPAIMTREMKLLRDLIRDHSDALRVRVLVALELIGRPGELSKSLSRRAIDQLYLDCRHMPQRSFLATKKHKTLKMKTVHDNYVL